MLGFGEHGSANDRAASSSLDQSKRLAAHPPPSLPELGACKCWHRDIIRDKSGRATDRETETAEGDGEWAYWVATLEKLSIPSTTPWPEAAHPERGSAPEWLLMELGSYTPNWHFLWSMFVFSVQILFGVCCYGRDGWSLQRFSCCRISRLLFSEEMEERFIPSYLCTSLQSRMLFTENIVCA